jgi:serine/threonine protein kinase
VKPGNIVSFGSSGTFKLIDMDSIYYTHDWEDDEEDEQPTQQPPRPKQQQQQQQQPQQRRRRRPVGGMLGDPCPASLSAHLAGDAAALQLQQQTPASGATASSTAAPQQQQQKQLNALSFAGTPENMAPEVAPTVLQLAVVLFDLFPLKEGQQVASSTAVAPAQDIWSVGTVLYELITGRWVILTHCCLTKAQHSCTAA